MAKISNLTSYPQISDLDKYDYLLITDKENALQTKNVSVEQLQKFFGINTNEAKVTVTAAQLLTSATIDVDIIPASLLATNEVIDILSISSVQANTATDLVLNITELTGAIAQDSALVLDGGSVNPTQGNGTMSFNILYRVLQVGSSF